ncbi:sigma-70 family RNA polymerase sigma factor [Neobacillus niacini]|uniref:sigma-70 family RNA polymerase sigma factor n=1 Tax=Neobacillus niacini TaxID=86668 RepID=UPI002FFEC681
MESEKNSLVENNIGLAAHIAHKYYMTLTPKSYFVFDDIFQEACIGLLKASRTFKEDKGKFSTYAGKCIANEILQYIRKQKRKLIWYHLENEVPTSTEDDSLTFQELVTSKRDDVEGQVMATFLSECMENQTKQFKRKSPRVEEREQKIFKLMLKGYRQSEIKDMVHLSQRVTAQHYEIIRRRVRYAWLH